MILDDKVSTVLKTVLFIIVLIVLFVLIMNALKPENKTSLLDNTLFQNVNFVKLDQCWSFPTKQERANCLYDGWCQYFPFYCLAKESGAKF